MYPPDPGGPSSPRPDASQHRAFRGLLLFPRPLSLFIRHFGQLLIILAHMSLGNSLALARLVRSGLFIRHFGQ